MGQACSYWANGAERQNVNTVFYSRIDGYAAPFRAEAERTQVPATALAREAIDLWLLHQLRKARHQAITAYAEEMADTDLDLDPVLEMAGISTSASQGKRGLTVVENPGWRRRAAQEKLCRMPSGHNASPREAHQEGTT